MRGRQGPFTLSGCSWGGILSEPQGQASIDARILTILAVERIASA